MTSTNGRHGSEADVGVIEALHDVAVRGTESTDQEIVLQRALRTGHRGRRRNVLRLVAAAAVAAVSVGTVTVVAGGLGDRGGVGPAASLVPSSAVVVPLLSVACGGIVDPARVETGERLSLSATAEPVPATAAERSPVTVTLTNTGGTRLVGSTGEPDLFVVKDGRIVAASTAHRAVATSLDLAVGASQHFDINVNVRHCVVGETAADSPQYGPRLEPGTYQLYAATTVTRDGQKTLVQGGPSPLTVE
jgi:hypothetical protein